VHEKHIEIRWGDLDAYGHVNNAVYLSYLEAARLEWIQRTFGGLEDLRGFVLVRLAIDFLRELNQSDERIVASCQPRRLGTSSITMREAVRTGLDEIAAEAETVIVARDVRSGRSRALSPQARVAVEAQLPSAGL
jgi:acyl-CoA thioester hydrolase